MTDFSTVVGRVMETAKAAQMLPLPLFVGDAEQNQQTVEFWVRAVLEAQKPQSDPEATHSALLARLTELDLEYTAFTLRLPPLIEQGRYLVDFVDNIKAIHRQYKILRRAVGAAQVADIREKLVSLATRFVDNERSRFSPMTVSDVD